MPAPAPAIDFEHHGNHLRMGEAQPRDGEGRARGGGHPDVVAPGVDEATPPGLGDVGIGDGLREGERGDPPRTG